MPPNKERETMPLMQGKSPATLRAWDCSLGGFAPKFNLAPELQSLHENYKEFVALDAR